MAISLVTTATVGNSGSGTTASCDTTGADLIIDAINGPSTSYVAGKDSKNLDAAWQNGTPQLNSAGSMGVGLDHILGPIVGAGHTFSSISNIFYTGVTAAAFSGVGSLDQEATGVSNTGSGTTHPATSAAVTPGAAGCLIIAVLGFDADPGTVTYSSGLGALVSCGPVNNLNCFVAYEIQTTATARTPVFTTTNSVRSAGVCKVFRASAAPAPPPPSYALSDDLIF